MRPNIARFDELLNSLREAATAFEKVFEDDLQVRILDFGERVAQNPTQTNVAHWLQLYSLVSNFSLDGVPDITDYRRKNGPTPPCYFFVDNYRSNRGNTPGMKRHGVSYSFDLNELHRTGTRGAFRIHPDGPPPGTHGCVGIAEDREKLLECAHKLDELRQQGRFRLAVKYGARPVPGLP